MSSGMTDPTAPGPWDEARWRDSERAARRSDADSGGAAAERPARAGVSAGTAERLSEPAASERAADVGADRASDAGGRGGSPAGDRAGDVVTAARPARAVSGGRSESAAGGPGAVRSTRGQLLGQELRRPALRDSGGRDRRPAELRSAWQRQMTMTAAAEAVRVALLAERLTSLIQQPGPAPELLAPAERGRWVGGPSWL
jgi:hypothetical protein